MPAARRVALLDVLVSPAHDLSLAREPGRRTIALDRRAGQAPRPGGTVGRGEAGAQGEPGGRRDAVKVTVAPAFPLDARIRSVTVTATLAPGYTLGQALASMQEVARKVLPPTAQTDLNGQSREFRDSSSDIYFVFVLALGYYITPALVGGPRDQMISYMITYQVNEVVNWGMASALGVLLLVLSFRLRNWRRQHLAPARDVGLGHARDAAARRLEVGLGHVEPVEVERARRGDVAEPLAHVVGRRQQYSCPAPAHFRGELHKACLRRSAGRENQERITLLDQRHRPVLDLRAAERLGLDRTGLLEFQRGFEGNREADATTDDHDGSQPPATQPPAVHVRSQAPQCWESDARSTQEAPHWVSP